MSEKYSVDDILAELEQRKDSGLNESDEYPKLEKQNRHEMLNNEDIQFKREKYSENKILPELKGTNSDYLPDINSGAFSLTEELKIIEQRRGIASHNENVQHNENTGIKKIESKTNSIGRVDFITNRNETESDFSENKTTDVKNTESISVTSILDDERLKSGKTNVKGIVHKNVNSIIRPNIYNQDIQENLEVKSNQSMQVTQILGENLQGKYKPQFENFDKNKRNTKPKKGEIIYEKARVLPKPLIENINLENPEDNTEKKSKYKEQDWELIKKRGLSLLERDIALEHPNELIDGINPYEIMKNAAKPLDKNEVSQYDDFMAGDTMGVAGNDLKELASRSAGKTSSASSTAEVGVKRYEPLVENKRKPVINIETEKAKRSNTALLESLNKAIREKRDSDIAANRTLPLNRNSNTAKSNLPANALNINYAKQIIMDTAATTSISLSSDPVLAEQKIMDLASKRKRKIRDFVLEDIESEENDPTYYDAEDSENEDDFDSYDSSGQIWKDLCNLHNSLKLRFIIQLIVTSVLVLITAMNDFQKDMAFSIAGTDILIFDKRYDPTGFLYLNLILGVIGLASCGTVITGGITRLFKRKGDCDSICAIPAVISLICVVPQLANTDFIQRSMASVFIAAGLGAMLFNTIGKLVMIKRAKRNFRFISGDNAKYYANLIEDSEMAQALTKGMLSNLPVLASMRKTEFLTDFLKNSYCTDAADMISRLLTPISFGVALVMGFLAYITPSGVETQNNIYWALTAGCGILTVLSPFSMMFIVNGSLNRAVKSLEKSDSVVMGYSSAVDFSSTNSVLVDAAALFPAGSVAFRNIKRCQQSSSLNAYAIDEAIITAASLAIKSGSILTYMFYDMIAGKNELLYDVDNCIYEVNMGISGWIGNKRIMLGNREQMKHHGINVPDIKKERKYCSENGDVVYLAVGGETVSMFFIEIIPNSEILRSMQELTSNGVSVVVRTKDSLVTVNKIADVFDVPPEMLRILPFSMHGAFEECTKYTSRGSSAIACNGTFTSFAASVIAAKKIISDVNISTWITYIGLFIAVVLGALFMIFLMPQTFTSTNVIIYNLALLVLTAVVQRFRRYG